MQIVTNLGLLARAFAVVTLTAALAACGGGTSDSAGSNTASVDTTAVRQGSATVASADVSANDSMIESAAQLVDVAGNRWTVSGGVISKDGSAETETQGVIAMVWSGGVLYQENIHCDWFSRIHTDWLPSSQPAATGIPACSATAANAPATNLSVTASATTAGLASPTFVASTDGSMIVPNPQLVDSAGNLWTVDGGVISMNGAPQTITQNVITLLYDNGVIYQENINCNWWSWTGGAWVATTQPAAAGIPTCGSKIPSVNASPDDSMIPSLTSIEDNAGNVWTVSNGVISHEGAARPLTKNVSVLLFDNGVIYKETSDCLWSSWTSGAWVATAKPTESGIPACTPGSSSGTASSSGSSSSGSSSSGASSSSSSSGSGSGASTSSSGSSSSGGSSAGVPAAAAAAGYNTMTYGPNVTIDSNWYPFTFYGSGAQPAGYTTQNADGSLYFSGTGHSSGDGAATAAHSSSGNKWTGTAFGGGAYFETVLSFTGQGSGPYNNGGPAFWMLDIEHTSQGPYVVSWPNVSKNSAGDPYDDYFEVDVMQYDSGPYSYQENISNWYGYPPTKSTSNPYTGGGGNGDVKVPTSTNFAEYHTYACLWVPATPSTQGYLKFYFDGEQNGGTLYWNYDNPNNPFPPPPQNNASAMSGMDARHMMLILGTGTDQPMTVKSVTVWQASGANNLKE
jgi:hypothetical protein